jgi:hypothetical protein
VIRRNAAVIAPGTPLPDFRPLLTADLPGGGRGALAGVLARDGREELNLTFSYQSDSIQFQVLAPGVIRWLTKGVHLGVGRSCFAVHIDDVLMPNARWIPVPPALASIGITTLASDASAEPDPRPVGTALTVPRHPIDLDYSTGTSLEAADGDLWERTAAVHGGSGECETDSVDPDNLNGYDQETGFPLTAEDQLRFNRMIARLAHERSLGVGLKNDLEQVEQLVGDFDFAVNESCVDEDECELLAPFVQAGKVVLHVEYDLPTDEFCAATAPLRFSSIRKPRDLTAPLEGCPEP